LIEGIDIASNQVIEATKLAVGENFQNIRYHVGDFLNHPFQPEKFDIVLFNSSLHHFNNINILLKSKVIPLLKKMVFSYFRILLALIRLQWTSLQLKQANLNFENYTIKI